MTRMLLRWILLACSVAAASFVTQALGLAFRVDLSGAAKFLQLLFGVAVLAFLNATLGRFLKFLTLPLNCLTLGLFSLVINASILWLVAGFGLGFTIEGDTWSQFLAALVGSLMIAFINGVLGVFLPDKPDD
jgi:putative membrane protein